MSSTEDLLLRPLTVDDLDLVGEIYCAARQAAAEVFAAPRAGVDALAHQLRGVVDGGSSRTECWVAEDDGPLGFAVLVDGWLEALYVAPERQRHGVGSALLELAKARFADGFGLWVFAANAAARGFYHRHGLIELDHTDGSENDDGQPAVRMYWPGPEPLAGLRALIDAVDDELAVLLARRFALTASVQGFKPVGGRVGRDADREAQIVARMSERAPGLDRDALARVMDVVIGAALDVADVASSRSRASTDGR